MPIFVLVNPANPQLQDSYVLAANAPNCPGPKERLCYIVAANDGLNRPILYEDLLRAMIQAVSTRTESLNVKLRSM